MGPPAHTNHTGLVYAWYRHCCCRALCLLLYRDTVEHRKQNGLPTIRYLQAWPGRPTALDDLLGSPLKEALCMDRANSPAEESPIDFNFAILPQRSKVGRVDKLT